MTITLDDQQLKALKRAIVSRQGVLYDSLYVQTDPELIYFYRKEIALLDDLYWDYFADPSVVKENVVK